MGITEKQRHDLFTKFEETLGPEHTATMMELLPPVGWADVATKRDQDAATVALQQDIGALDQRLSGRIDRLDQALSGRIDRLDERLSGRIDRLEARMATKDDLHQLRRDVATWLFGAMGVQTAVIGILVALT